MRRVSHGPSGFALIWAIVTITVIAVLVAAAAPSLVTLDDRLRAERAARQLRSIADGFVTFGVVVGHYPGNVSELTNVLTETSPNTCRVPMTASDVANWPTKAPYVPFYTPTSGSWTDIGRIRDSVPARDDPPAKTPIYVELPGVTESDAAMLDLIIDNGSGDTVTYAAPVNDTTTVRYRVVSSQKIANKQC